MADTLNNSQLPTQPQPSAATTTAQAMNDEEQQHQQQQQEFYTNAVEEIFTNNKVTDAQNSLKQIAKILQAIAKSPADKKKRQHPQQGIIVKKFIYGVAKGLDLMKILGFEEATVDAKPYLSLPDDATILVNNQCDAIADALLAFSTKTTTKPPTAAATTTTATTTTNTDAKKDDNTMSDDATKQDTDKTDSIPKVEEKRDEPTHCATPNCGFFGTKATRGYCSACFKKVKATESAANGGAGGIAGQPLVSPILLRGGVAGGMNNTAGARPNSLQKLVGGKVQPIDINKCMNKTCNNQKWKNHHVTDILDYTRKMSEQPITTLLPTATTTTTAADSNNTQPLLAVSPTTNNSIDTTNVEGQQEMKSPIPNDTSIQNVKPTPTRYCAVCFVTQYDYPRRIAASQEKIKKETTSTTTDNTMSDEIKNDNNNNINTTPTTTDNNNTTTSKTIIDNNIPTFSAKELLQQKRKNLNAKLFAYFNFKSVMRPVQFNKERCWKCSRKIGITGTECRCKFIFCGRCRDIGVHGCTYNQQQRWQEILEKTSLNDINRAKVEGDDDE
eukprot:UN01326